MDRRTAIALSAAVACAMFAIASAVTISIGLFSDRAPRVSTIDVVSARPSDAGSDEVAAPAAPVATTTPTTRAAAASRNATSSDRSPTTPAPTAPPAAGSALDRATTTTAAPPRTVPPTTATTRAPAQFPTLGSIPFDDSRSRSTTTTVARSPFTSVWPGHNDDD